MKDESCIRFLQWALPRLNMRWPGFRKVRGQVCKRLYRRLRELRLPDLENYRMYLEDNPMEWHILDSLCRITISRFYRDRGVFDLLQSQVLPELVKNARRQERRDLSCWCIGGASGEEPYTVSLLWSLSGAEVRGFNCYILATEVDLHMIDRAREGCYPASSICELPAEIKEAAFIRKNGLFCLKEKYKKRVKFLQQDIRKELPEKTFDLIFCRNLVFTYYSRRLQQELSEKIVSRLNPGGILVLGAHEELPGPLPDLSPRSGGRKIYQKTNCNKNNRLP